MTLLIRENLWQRPFRNGILAICVAAVVGMQVAAAFIDWASTRGLKVGIERLGADLVAVPRGLDDKLVRSYITGEAALFYMDGSLKDKISGFSWVEKTSAQLYIKSLSGASCCSAWNLFLIGFEPETDFTIQPWLSEHTDGVIGPDEILVGAALGVEPGMSLRFYGRSFKVVGTLAPTGMGLDTTVFIPLKTAYLMAKESAARAEKTLEIDQNQISAVTIKLKPEDKGGLPGWKAAYELEMAIPEISVIQPDDMVAKVQSNLSSTLKTLKFASYVIWPVAALLIGLVFAMAANERQRDIGLLRAMGATRGFIFRMIILEALLIAAIGASIGLIVSMGLVSLFSRLIALKLETPFYRPDAAEIAAIVFMAALLSLLTGAASAMLPAIQAGFKEPYEAIRRGE